MEDSNTNKCKMDVETSADMESESLPANGNNNEQTENQKGSKSTVKFASGNIRSSLQMSCVEQLDLLLRVWTKECYDAAKKSKDEKIYMDQYLNVKPKHINSEFIEALLHLEYNSLDKLLSKFETDAPAPKTKHYEDFQSLTADRNCRLCLFECLTRINMFQCKQNIDVKLEQGEKCTIAVIGINSILLERVKDAMTKLHQMKCSCAYCLQAIENYDCFVKEVALHEMLHREV